MNRAQVFWASGGDLFCRTAYIDDEMAESLIEIFTDEEFAAMAARDARAFQAAIDLKDQLVFARVKALAWRRAGAARAA